MNLTEDEAAELVEILIARLTEFNADDVAAGIEESRRMGVEESVREGSPRFERALSKADIREVGKTRRRPRTNSEMLRLVIDRLHQRLVVLPKIAQSLKEKLGGEIVWRVEPEFTSAARTQALQADVQDLLPSDLPQIMAAFQHLLELLGENYRTGASND